MLYESRFVAMPFEALCWRPQFIVRATVLGENLTRDHQRASRLASFMRVQTGKGP